MLRGWGLEVFVVALATVETASVLSAGGPSRVAAAAVTAASVLVLLARRWQALAASLAAFGLLTVGIELMPRSTLAQFFGLLATFAICGAVNRDREAVAAWLAGAGTLAYAAWGDPFGGGLGDFLLSLAFGTTMWGAGWLVARRGRQAAQSARRAEQAEREQLATTRQALAEERARIAREMHDVVSHGLSVVVVQAQAARGALADLAGAAGPADGEAEVERHLDAVEVTARDALGEMRRMLGLLQVEELPGAFDMEPEPPTPGVRNVAALVDRARAAGIDVEVTGPLPDDPLPAGLDLTVYRVAQEALTNVVKHAPGAHVDLSIACCDGRVVVDVLDDGGGRAAGGPPGTGHGLVGMRERVTLYGGTVQAAPTAAGGFRVHAVVPVEGDSSAPPRRTPWIRRRGVREEIS